MGGGWRRESERDSQEERGGQVSRGQASWGLWTPAGGSVVALTATRRNTLVLDYASVRWVCGNRFGFLK
jgi:hypothetical protein